MAELWVTSAAKKGLILLPTVRTMIFFVLDKKLIIIIYNIVYSE